MKTIKYVLMVCWVILYNAALYTQEYKIPVNNTRDGKLILEDFMGFLPIEGYDGKEIIITRTNAFGDNNSSTPERAAGLKPIYSGGIDNTAIGLHVDNDGNKITVRCLLPLNKRREYKVRVPDHLSLKVQSGCLRSNDVTVSDILNDIEIINCQSITLRNVTGSIVITTISGNIDIEKCVIEKDATISVSAISGNIVAVFKEVNTKEPISFNSISGEVDITLPPKVAANLVLKSISGVVYSDFEFPEGDKNTNQIVGTKIENPMNGGGTSINLSTVSGNIYLRKNK